ARRGAVRGGWGRPVRDERGAVRQRGGGWASPPPPGAAGQPLRDAGLVFVRARRGGRSWGGGPPAPVLPAPAPSAPHRLPPARAPSAHDVLRQAPARRAVGRSEMARVLLHDVLVAVPAAARARARGRVAATRWTVALARRVGGDRQRAARRVLSALAERVVA